MSVGYNYEAILNANYDILKEIGSIGMGHASTALSQMLNMKITINIPEVYAMSVSSATAYLKERKSDSYVVRLGLQGDSKGEIFQILNKDFVNKVVHFFFQTDVDDIYALDEMFSSLLHEIGNITSGAYCNSLAALTGLFIDITTPSYCPECDATFLEGKNSELPNQEIFIVKNSFYFGVDEVKSSFLFIPEYETVEMILGKLREYYGFVN
ncbi:MAG: chemotaxis protein CheC [Oscillospiraceae bacterium]|nr:chemotaxis protein CheC [Oscillospiraceae bacterium]